MSETAPPPFMDPDWMDAQRRYWSAWLDLARKGAHEPGEAQAWRKAAEQWWAQACDRTPPESRAFFEKLMQQGGAYFDLADGFRNALAGGGDGAGWREAFDGACADLARALETGGGAHPFGMLAFWRQPLDAWREALPALLGGMPGGAGQDPEAEHEARVRALGMPGLGLGREWQGDAQEAARLWLDYQRALDDYNAEFRKLGLAALERLRARVLALAEAEGEIRSVRELYDLWVDCGEEAYAERVATEDYAEVYARLVNSLMRFRRHQQQTSDRLAGLLNLPTRRELDAVHRRMHALRRELAQLRRAVTGAAPAGAEPPPEPGAHKGAGRKAPAGRAVRKKAGARRAPARKREA